MSFLSAPNQVVTQLLSCLEWPRSRFGQQTYRVFDGTMIAENLEVTPQEALSKLNLITQKHYPSWTDKHDGYQ